MKEKEEVIFYSVTGLIIAFAIISWFLIIEIFNVFLPNYVGADTTSAVTVTAPVSANISCSTDVSSSTFGTLATYTISTSTPNASTTMSCVNSYAGCTLYIKDAGGGGNPGLWNSTSSSIIPSPNAAYDATATLVIGTSGYGIQATTTVGGSGDVLTIARRYLQTGNTVGGLLITNTTLASSTATSTNRAVVVTHKAAISAAVTAGSYNDTITYECTAN
jgi:hypothetical protein